MEKDKARYGLALAVPHLAPAHPAIHLAPELGWMNDPNGLSFVDGVWHAYYQHNPDDDVWGPMHWRHATSPDLVTWTDHGIVLWPGPLGAAFSGSVVVDEWDSAGFGAGARVAVFTLDLHHDQRQGLAWSTDGFTWNLYDGNPVLTDPTEEHFRDPKVVRFEDRWVMALAVGPEIRFYRSPDLKKWEQTGFHQPDPRPTNPIECPDLVPLRTEAGEDCWLLIYGDDRGGAGNHSSTMALVGQFDGGMFEPLSGPTYVDQGPDFYAAQTFYGVGAGEPPILMAWMNSWQYANEHPSSGRRGVQSLPRSLSVASLADPVVRSRPAVDLDELFTEPYAGDDPSGRPVWVSGTAFSMAVTSVHGTAAAVRCDGSTVVLERAGIPGLDGPATAARMPADGGLVTVLVDHGTVEVFTASGRTMTALVFPGDQWAVETAGDTRARILA